jgi:ApaG protein
MSETLTRGIRVSATAFYLPHESDPDARRFLFGYIIIIVNESGTAVQLLSRNWIVIDAAGRTEQINGPGVIGQTPRLEPGETFRYSSFSPLSTPWGTMEGAYRMRADSGEEFDVAIGRFYLTLPAEQPTAGPSKTTH